MIDHQGQNFEPEHIEKILAMIWGIARKLFEWPGPSDKSDSLQTTFFSKHSGAKKPCVPPPLLGNISPSGFKKVANPKSPLEH